MQSLYTAIKKHQARGYAINFVAKFDHLEADGGTITLRPGQFIADSVERFDNSSDPDDQSILYAITSKDGSLKGLFAESYGIYHEELSPEMMMSLVSLQR